MEKCIFCGSPAKSWPSHIENTQVADNVPLCEFHLSVAIKTCVVEERDPKEFYYLEKWNHALRELDDRIEKWVKENIEEDEDPESEDSYFSQIGNIARESLGANYKYLKPPEREYLEESELTRWLCLRLTDIARNGKPYRCTAYRDGAPDQRCRNRTERKGGLCDMCLKHNRESMKGQFWSEKIDKCVEILKQEE